MKVLVIGGTRFLGIDTVDRWLERSHEVAIYNRGTRKGLWPGRVRELQGDRADSRALRQLEGEDVDGIVDLCAYTARDTRALLGVLGNVSRYVHMSSGTVYRLHPQLPWPEDTPYGPVVGYLCPRKDRMRAIPERRTPRYDRHDRHPSPMGPWAKELRGPGEVCAQPAHRPRRNLTSR